MNSFTSSFASRDAPFLHGKIYGVAHLFSEGGTGHSLEKNLEGLENCPGSPKRGSINLYDVWNKASMTSQRSCLLVSRDCIPLHSCPRKRRLTAAERPPRNVKKARQFSLQIIKWGWRGRSRTYSRYETTCEWSDGSLKDTFMLNCFHNRETLFFVQYTFPR